MTKLQEKSIDHLKKKLEMANVEIYRLKCEIEVMYSENENILKFYEYQKKDGVYVSREKYEEYMKKMRILEKRDEWFERELKKQRIEEYSESLNDLAEICKHYA